MSVVLRMLIDIVMIIEELDELVIGCCRKALFQTLVIVGRTEIEVAHNDDLETRRFGLSDMIHCEGAKVFASNAIII